MILEQPNFDLKDFVASNFMDRSMKSLEFVSDTTQNMYEHIESMGDKLTRGPNDQIASYFVRVSFQIRQIPKIGFPSKTNG